MGIKGILLCGLLVLAALWAITSAIIAAAPTLAVAIVVILIGLVIYAFNKSS